MSEAEEKVEHPALRTVKCKRRRNSDCSPFHIRYFADDRLKMCTKDTDTSERTCFVEPFGPGAGHLQFSTPIYVRCEYFMNQEGNIRKYTTFCGGINEDGERKSKKIVKYVY